MFDTCRLRTDEHSSRVFEETTGNKEFTFSLEVFYIVKVWAKIHQTNHTTAERMSTNDISH